MTRHTQSLLRAPIQGMLWSLLLVALIGPHYQWKVCLTGGCCQTVAATGESCCNEMDTASGDREWIDDPSRCCCVDLEIVFEEGPVPKPVRVPDVEEHIVAVLPPMVTAPPGASIARLEDYVRGPPRVDRRLDVIATTVLRE